MTTRAKYQTIAKESLQALITFDKTLAHIKLETAIVDLVKIRASQLNGCLFCLDLHCKEAKKHNERELRIYHLPLWRESELFNERERAALLWTEQLTRPSVEGITDEIYEEAAKYFSEEELTQLTVVISSINAWNRFGMAFKPTAGSLDKIYGLEKLGLL
ncbi:MAG: carboxymuconolactone decarboxylase family protein [Proteobacteria bacterium]|nr:carboxymuconolactone decarboxylase family protein [Pseudomonadota bacterium]